MLREITGVTQDTVGVSRRWFHDDYFDLFVRQDGAGEIIGSSSATEWATPSMHWCGRRRWGTFTTAPMGTSSMPNISRSSSPASAAMCHNGSARRCSASSRIFRSSISAPASAAGSSAA